MLVLVVIVVDVDWVIVGFFGSFFVGVMIGVLFLGIGWFGMGVLIGF